MSKWRFEVVKERCKSFDTPTYVTYSMESMTDYFLNYLYDDDLRKANESINYWYKYTSEIPKRRVSTEYNWELQKGTFGNGKCHTTMQIEMTFPAKRIGRMFPRHKQQIIYKGDK